MANQWDGMLVGCAQNSGIAQITDFIGINLKLIILWEQHNMNLIPIFLLLVTVLGCDSESKVPLSEKLDARGGALMREVCEDLMSTRKFDTYVRREILKGYGFPLAVISEIESNVASLGTMGGCMFTVGFQTSMWEMIEDIDQ